MMNDRKEPAADAAERRPYETPSVQRVDLALEETLSAGCKLAGVCDDPFTGSSGPGS